MKFQLQKRFREDTEFYERDPIEKYVDYLREKGRILEMGNLLFDTQAMTQPFVCSTRQCIPDSGRNGSRRNGLSPDRHKPSACVMFLLFLLETNDEKGTILVASHSPEVMALGEADDGGHTAVGCLKKNPYACGPLYVEMKNTLIAMFGQKAWDLLDRALRERNACP